MAKLHGRALAATEDRNAARRVRAQRSLRTYRTYRPTLDILLWNSYTKIYVDEATREDLLKFMSDCFRLGIGSRTVYDKLVIVLQLFKLNGKKGLLEKGN